MGLNRCGIWPVRIENNTIYVTNFVIDEPNVIRDFYFNTGVSISYQYRKMCWFFIQTNKTKQKSTHFPIPFDEIQFRCIEIRPFFRFLSMDTQRWSTLYIFFIANVAQGPGHWVHVGKISIWLDRYIFTLHHRVRSCTERSGKPRSASFGNGKDTEDSTSIWNRLSMNKDSNDNDKVVRTFLYKTFLYKKDVSPCINSTAIHHGVRTFFFLSGISCLVCICRGNHVHVPIWERCLRGLTDSSPKWTWATGI